MESKEEDIMFNGAQLHLIVNHLPIVGFVLFIPVILMAVFTRRSDYKRLALLAAAFLEELAEIPLNLLRGCKALCLSFGEVYFPVLSDF